MNEDSLRSGELARKGILSAEAIERAGELIDRVAAEGVESIRLVVVDQHGLLRGKTILADQLTSAFRSGVMVGSTLLLKDTSHRTVFPVWGDDIGFGSGVMTGAGDLMIVPDPTTFRRLPWTENSAWLLCDIHFNDGRPLPFCTRSILKAADRKLNDAGMAFVCGLELEFFVFAVDDENLRHEQGGMPGTPPSTRPLHHGFQYLTDARYDDLEHIMEEIRKASVALRLPIRTMEAEFGPSQFEFTFNPDGALAHADHTVLFRSMVKQVCRRMGLHATFMCRPRLENLMASGLHLHMSVTDLDGKNLFEPPAAGELTPTGSGWIAGLLEHAHATCVLTTPTVNGYKRYQPFQLAPDRVQWGVDNKGAMIRGLMKPGDSASRIENRVAEPAANPYLYLASQIMCGLDGVSRGLSAPPAVESPYASDAKRLPPSLISAIEQFEASDFYKKELGEEVVKYLSYIKRAEWERYLMTVSEWEHREYFSLF